MGVLVRKFIVLAIAVFLADTQRTFGLQVTAALCVMCIATGLQLLYAPYQNRTEQLLETLSLGGITFSCMVGQVMQQGEKGGLGESGLAACRVAVMLTITGIGSRSSCSSCVRCTAR